MSFGFKHDYNDQFSVGLTYNQPFGVSVDYANTTGAPSTAGTKAELTTDQLTLVGRYKLGNGFGVHAGARGQWNEAEIELAKISYSAKVDRDFETGYLFGATYEKPEYAMRFGLTYYSPIKHKSTATETGFSDAYAPGETNITDSELNMPKSVAFDFQSGVNANTLVFGSVTWTEWKSVEVRPENYYRHFINASTAGLVAAGANPAAVAVYNEADDGSLYAPDENVYTLKLGVGRKINDNWSGAVTLGYEKAQGGEVGNLAPTDGYKSIGLGATYTQGNMKVTGGLEYVDVGDATTSKGKLQPNTYAEFKNNSVIGAGVRVQFSF